MRTDLQHRRRPGRAPGRCCVGALLCGLSLFAAPADLSAQEVFSWFNRGLLPVEFHEGDWVRYEATSIDEYGPVTDTLSVSVVSVADDSVWLRMESARERDFVSVDPARLSPGRSILDALTRVVRQTDEGWVEEDLERLRESALAQRHFSDPFHEPVLLRQALADTVCSGVSLQREAVALTETRREGAGGIVIVTQLEARAEISAAIPLTGLLRSRTNSVVSTESATAGSGRRRPPFSRRPGCAASVSAAMRRPASPKQSNP